MRCFLTRKLATGWAAAAVICLLASPTGAAFLVDSLVEPENGWTSSFAWSSNGHGGLVSPSDQEVGGDEIGLFSNGSLVSHGQFGSLTLMEGEYTVMFSIANPSNSPFPSPNVRVILGGLIFDRSNPGGGDDISNTTPTPASGGWALWSITYDVPAGDPRIGDPLNFSIQANSGSNNADLDGVGALSGLGDGLLIFGPIPEPSAFALGLLALAALGLVGWRRR